MACSFPFSLTAQKGEWEKTWNFFKGKEAKKTWSTYPLLSSGLSAAKSLIMILIIWQSIVHQKRQLWGEEFILFDLRVGCLVPREITHSQILNWVRLILHFSEFLSAKYQVSMTRILIANICNKLLLHCNACLK